MKIKRCNTLMLELRESRGLDLESVLAGLPRLECRSDWVALCAHSDREVRLDELHLRVLREIPSGRWSERDALLSQHPPEAVDFLLANGLLLDAEGAASEAAMRLEDWHPVAAIAHRHLRWSGVDTEAAIAKLESSGTSLREQLGPPPLLAPDYDAGAQIELLREGDCSALDRLARSRATCRNFDPDQELSFDVLTRLMERVYAAVAISTTADTAVMKRRVASAGGLHAVDAFLLIQGVESLAPGLYNYHPVRHVLQTRRTMDLHEARMLAARFVAQQPWFAAAPVLVVLVARFRRNFWKYRRHAKSLRALILDAGHLSHHQYLVATELGLGAFITAAINEGDIEDAFGLDPMQEGVLAVTGFGYRGASMDVLEFDPLQKVWPEWKPE